MGFKTMDLPEVSERAPDGSSIRPLHEYEEGGLAHCTLPESCVSKASKHRTVSEIWFFIEGEGELWRRLRDHEKIVRVEPGISITIPVHTSFQFRNTGTGSLKFLCVTMPRWPGFSEAEFVEGPWDSILQNE
jgi:mannose-6-phosphate isomerase-like protein (cupin superfamily)